MEQLLSLKYVNKTSPIQTYCQGVHNNVIIKFCIKKKLVVSSNKRSSTVDIYESETIPSEHCSLTLGFVWYGHFHTDSSLYLNRFFHIRVHQFVVCVKLAYVCDTIFTYKGRLHIRVHQFVVCVKLAYVCDTIFTYKGRLLVYALSKRSCYASAR